METLGRYVWRNIYAAYRTRRAAHLYRATGRTIRQDVFSVDVAGRTFRFLTTDDFSKFHFFVTDAGGEKAREVGLTQELCKLLPRAKCFADVGANVGYYSCIAAGVNPAVSVYAFELDGLNVDRMRRNIELNGSKNIEIVHAAVTDAPGEVVYIRPPENNDMPCSTLTIAPQSFDRIGAREERVPAVTLDGFFLSRGAAPDVVKIDVEGAEFHVLRGMTKLIERHRPTIFVELHAVALPKFGHSIAEVIRFLRSWNYDLYHVEDHRRGADVRITPIPADGPVDHLVLVAARPPAA